MALEGIQRKDIIRADVTSKEIDTMNQIQEHLTVIWYRLC